MPYDFDGDSRNVNVVRSDHESVHRLYLIFIVLCITGTGIRKGTFDSGFVEEAKDKR